MDAIFGKTADNIARADCSFGCTLPCVTIRGPGQTVRCFVPTCCGSVAGGPSPSPRRSGSLTVQRSVSTHVHGGGLEFHSVDHVSGVHGRDTLDEVGAGQLWGPAALRAPGHDLWHVARNITVQISNFEQNRNIPRSNPGI